MGEQKLNHKLDDEVSSSGCWSIHSISHFLQPDCPQRIMHIQSRSEQSWPVTSVWWGRENAGESGSG